MEAKRRNFVGGNWKSNLTVSKVEDLVTKILNPVNIDTTKTGNYIKHYKNLKIFLYYIIIK